MANNQTPKLRAFVRIDGSGRVVSGTPVLQASKPKVGQWREIPLYYRGNSTTTSTTTASPSTTTTTTTATPSTTTTTTAAPFYTFNVDTIPRGDSNTACANYGSTLTQMFSNVATLVNGSVLYTDSSLTSPFSGVNGSWFGVNNNGTTSAIQVAFSTGVVSNITPC